MNWPKALGSAAVATIIATGVLACLHFALAWPTVFDPVPTGIAVFLGTLIAHAFHWAHKGETNE